MEVVSCFGLTSSSAAGWIVWCTIVKHLVSYVAVALGGSINGAVVEEGTSEAREVVGLFLDVAVASSDDNVEIMAPLTIVGGSVSLNGCAPKDTLDNGGAGWVRAVEARVKGGITLEVDVEGRATVPSIAKRRTLVGVICCQAGVSEVTHRRLSASIEVCESVDPARRGCGSVGCV